MRKAARGTHGTRGRVPPKVSGRRLRRRQGHPEKRSSPERRPRRPAGGTAIPLANLGAQIAAAGASAARFKFAMTATNVTLNKTACARYVPALEKQFGVCVDECPELTELVTMRRWETRHQDRLYGLQAIGPKLAALLERQREARRKFMARYPQAAIALDVATHEHFATDDLARFTTDYKQWDGRCELFVASLRGLPCLERQRVGRVANAALQETARAVANWTAQRRPGKRDWKATAMILSCYGWDLRRALGCSSLEEQAARLEDRVRKAHDKGQIATL